MSSCVSPPHGRFAQRAWRQRWHVHREWLRSGCPVTCRRTARNALLFNAGDGPAIPAIENEQLSLLAGKNQSWQPPRRGLKIHERGLRRDVVVAAFRPPRRDRARHWLWVYRQAQPSASSALNTSTHWETRACTLHRETALDSYRLAPYRMPKAAFP